MYATEHPWKDAELFATQAHASIGQLRKYTREPYIRHPIAVAEMVRRALPHDLNAIRAALLHDVVEDTPITLAAIREHFGEDVAQLVDALTDYQTPADGNRAFRKKNYREKIGASCPRAKTIKIADCLHNGRDIAKYDPRFALTYLQEIEELVPFLEEGDRELLQQLKTFLTVQMLLLT